MRKKQPLNDGTHTSPEEVDNGDRQQQQQHPTSTMSSRNLGKGISNVSDQSSVREPSNDNIESSPPLISRPGVSRGGGEEKLGQTTNYNYSSGSATTTTEEYNSNYIPETTWKQQTTTSSLNSVREWTYLLRGSSRSIGSGSFAEQESSKDTSSQQQNNDVQKPKLAFDISEPDAVREVSGVVTEHDQEKFLTPSNDDRDDDDPPPPPMPTRQQQQRRPVTKPALKFTISDANDVVREPSNEMVPGNPDINSNVNSGTSGRTTNTNETAAERMTDNWWGISSLGLGSLTTASLATGFNSTTFNDSNKQRESLNLKDPPPSQQDERIVLKDPPPQQEESIVLKDPPPQQGDGTMSASDIANGSHTKAGGDASWKNAWAVSPSSKNDVIVGPPALGFQISDDGIPREPSNNMLLSESLSGGTGPRSNYAAAAVLASSVTKPTLGFNISNDDMPREPSNDMLESLTSPTRAERPSLTTKILNKLISLTADTTNQGHASWPTGHQGGIGTVSSSAATADNSSSSNNNSSQSLGPGQLRMMETSDIVGNVVVAANNDESSYPTVQQATTTMTTTHIHSASQTNTNIHVSEPPDIETGVSPPPTTAINNANRRQPHSPTRPTTTVRNNNNNNSTNPLNAPVTPMYVIQQKEEDERQKLEMKLERREIMTHRCLIALLVLVAIGAIVGITVGVLGP